MFCPRCFRASWPAEGLPPTRLCGSLQNLLSAGCPLLQPSMEGQLATSQPWSSHAGNRGHGSPLLYLWDLFSPLIPQIALTNTCNSQSPAGCSRSLVSVQVSVAFTSVVEDSVVKEGCAQSAPKPPRACHLRSFLSCLACEHLCL